MLTKNRKVILLLVLLSIFVFLGIYIYSAKNSLETTDNNLKIYSSADTTNKFPQFVYDAPTNNEQYQNEFLTKVTYPDITENKLVYIGNRMRKLLDNKLSDPIIMDFPISNVTVSPDKKFIAFRANYQFVNNILFEYDVENDLVRKISSNSEGEIAYSLDGRYLAFFTIFKAVTNQFILDKNVNKVYQLEDTSADVYANILWAKDALIINHTLAADANQSKVNIYSTNQDNWFDLTEYIIYPRRDAKSNPHYLGLVENNFIYHTSKHMKTYYTYEEILDIYGLDISTGKVKEIFKKDNEHFIISASASNFIYFDLQGNYTVYEIKSDLSLTTLKTGKFNFDFLKQNDNYEHAYWFSEQNTLFVKFKKFYGTNEGIDKSFMAIDLIQDKYTEVTVELPFEIIKNTDWKPIFNNNNYFYFDDLNSNHVWLGYNTLTQGVIKFR